MLATLREINISIISILAYKLRAVLWLILQSVGFLFIVIELKIPAQVSKNGKDRTQGTFTPVLEHATYARATIVLLSNL